MIRNCRRDLRALEATMSSEKQFDRKVELNVQVREIQERLRSLTVPCWPGNNNTEKENVP